MTRHEEYLALLLELETTPPSRAAGVVSSSWSRA